MKPRHQNVNIIKFLDCDLNAIKNNKCTYDNPMQLLTLIGLSLKYHDANQIYNIISKELKREEREEENKIIQKYGLNIDNEEECMNHPEFDNITKEVEKIILHHSHGYSKTSNSFDFIDKLMMARYTEEEIDAIQETYQTTNRPLVFIRKSEDGNTSVSFVTFDHQKTHIEDIDFSLTFQLFDETSTNQKEMFLRILNKSIDIIANLEIKDTGNLIQSPTQELEYGSEHGVSPCHIL